MHRHRCATVGLASLVFFFGIAPALGGGFGLGAGGITSGDFNGDGRDDLIVTAHNEDLVGAVDCGGVQVIYGGAGGLTTIRDKYWHQNKAGINDTADGDDEFGHAVAVGDFDGDGFDDLAIGVPNEDVNGISSAGAVSILYGSPMGLRAAGDQLWHQDSVGVADSAEEFDNFGAGLASGDFDNDGFDDLAIGVPGQDFGKIADAGAVNVLYGSNSGIRASGDQFWHQDVDEVEDSVESFDYFGAHLAAGDFNGDGRDDLAIGGGEEDVEDVPAAGGIAGFDINDAGAINVLYGSASGLDVAGDQFWSKETEGIEGEGESFSFWSLRMAVGDFNGDGSDDLAVGAPYDTVAPLPSSFFLGLSDAGTVTVIYGSSDGGLTAEGSQLWSEDSPGIDEEPNSFNSFGFGLAAADFDSDGHDDLAIGVPGSNKSSGVAHVIYGSSDGLDAAGSQVWHQGIGDLPTDQGIDDFFGELLGAGDFDGDGEDDLAIGVPGEDLFGVTNCGAVQVLYGANSGLEEGDNQFWHQDKVNINNHCGTDDYWGGDEFFID